MIHLSEKNLKELLRKSYDAGWHGIRELKESAVDDIINEYRTEQISGYEKSKNHVYQTAMYNYVPPTVRANHVPTSYWG